MPVACEPCIWRQQSRGNPVLWSSRVCRGRVAGDNHDSSAALHAITTQPVAACQSCQIAACGRIPATRAYLSGNHWTDTPLMGCIDGACGPAAAAAASGGHGTCVSPVSPQSEHLSLRAFPRPLPYDVSDYDCKLCTSVLRIVAAGRATLQVQSVYCDKSLSEFLVINATNLA